MAGKRVKDYTDTQGTYDGELYVHVDKEGLTTAKKQKLNTIVPELYKLTIENWDMQSTLYHDQAIDPGISARAIGIMSISIIDDTAYRNIHSASGIFDATFYTNYIYGYAEAQAQTAHTHTPSIFGTNLTGTIPTHLHSIPSPSGTNSDTVAINSESRTYKGFAGQIIAIRAYINKQTNELKMMHNNTFQTTGREMVEGFATISASAQMANFAAATGTRGYAFLILEPAVA